MLRVERRRSGAERTAGVAARVDRAGGLEGGVDVVLVAGVERVVDRVATATVGLGPKVPFHRNFLRVCPFVLVVPAGGSPSELVSSGFGNLLQYN